jgi:hypothetical protein
MGDDISRLRKLEVDKERVLRICSRRCELRRELQRPISRDERIGEVRVGEDQQTARIGNTEKIVRREGGDATGGVGVVESGMRVEVGGLRDRSGKTAQKRARRVRKMRGVHREQFRAARCRR